MNLKCCIVDDEPLALDLLESYVQKTPFLTLCGKFTDAISALDFINRDDIDLAFLDIQMPDINGMELSKMIRNRCRIIFTTAFSQYAVDSYKIPAIDYLLKPISYADFLEACNRAVEWFELKNKHVQTENGNTGIESIFVKSDYKLRQIELKKILYTGVMTTTFSAVVVILRTMLEIAGTTPVQKISHSFSIDHSWRVFHQF